MDNSIQDWIQLAMFGVVVIGWLYSILKKVERPDEAADKRISKIETICPVQHLAIEEKFRLMNEKSLAIDNHLKHIEKCLSTMDKNIAVILDREIREGRITKI